MASRLSRRDAANIAAWRQGIPKTQACLDGMWGAIAGRLNATLPSKQTPVEARLASPQAAGGRRANTAVDWGSIVASLNADAGFAPAR
jgi:hypothetical protein